MVNKECVVCSKPYRTKPYLANRSKYCSRECQIHGQYPSITKVCKGCKKEFKVSNSRVNTKFCSLHCKSLLARTNKESRKNERNVTSKRLGFNHNRNIRKSLGLEKFVCAVCGYNEHKFCLDIHHLDHNAENNNLENIIILCAICHRKLHWGIHASLKR